MTDCISIDCVFNKESKKGLCIGISGKTRTNNVVRQCWVDEIPEAGKDCKVQTQAFMMPSEAVAVGVALIRSSIVGETILRQRVVNDEKKTTSQAP